MRATRHIKYFFIMLALLLVQTQIMRLVELNGITPDLLTIWIVYLALKEGQIPATIWGFVIGLAFDLTTGNFIGLSAFTKTLAGFTAGYFYNENKTPLTLGSYRYIVIVLVVSFIHDSIYFMLFTRGSDIGILTAIFQKGLATTFCTTTVTVLPMFAFARKMIS
jgi:rod shape-determining protein MreD